MIKNTSLDQNPREKALRDGIETLADYELLALILRTGNKQESVLELSKHLLSTLTCFSQLKELNYAELVNMKGIKKAKAIEILAIIEISKRLYRNTETSIELRHPSDIYQLLKGEMRLLKQEHFILLCLDNKNRLIKQKTMFIGTINMSVVSVREVFKEALSINAVSIICVHNHPSGDCTPSSQDYDMTNALKESGNIMNIDVLDHIVIGWNEFYSIVGQCKYCDEQFN